MKSEKKTSDWTYDDFVDWAFQLVFNGLVRDGLNGMKNELKYGVIQEMHNLMMQGGFKEKK